MSCSIAEMYSSSWSTSCRSSSRANASAHTQDRTTWLSSAGEWYVAANSAAARAAWVSGTLRSRNRITQLTQAGRRRADRRERASPLLVGQRHLACLTPTPQGLGGHPRRGVLD